MANIVSSSLVSDPRARDFRNFLWEAWREIGLPNPTALQYDFAMYLQEGARTMEEIAAASRRGDEGAKKILMAFRGASKSYVTTAFAVWRLWRDRTELVLVTSATAKYAGAIANFAFQMVNNFSFLADMKPRAGQRMSALAFDVSGCPAAVKDESFASESIFGQVTGRRASLIIGDDLETPNTSDTEGRRADLRTRTAELGGAVLIPGGDMFLLGTAQTEDTIYRDYAEEKGYELRIYPIVYPLFNADPKKDELVKYGPRLAPFIRNAVEANPELAGTSVEPSRFSERDIKNRQLIWGNTEFDRQFKMFLDAGMGKGNPLHMRDLVVMEISPPLPTDKDFLLPSVLEFPRLAEHRLPEIEVDALTGDSTVYSASKADIFVPPEEIVCYVDPSGSGEDETTWTIGAGLLGRIFALHQGSSVLGHTQEVMAMIAADCKQWRVQIVEVESNFGQGMFGELLAPELAKIGHVAEIVDIRQGPTSKERRIVETLEPVITGHRLVINAALLRADFTVDREDIEAAQRRYFRLTYQLSRMTKAKGCVKHDDRGDGLSGLARHFVGVLKRQLEKSEQAGRVRAIEIEGERLIALRKAQGLDLHGLNVHTNANLGRPTARRRPDIQARLH